VVVVKNEMGGCVVAIGVNYIGGQILLCVRHVFLFVSFCVGIQNAVLRLQLIPLKSHLRSDAWVDHNLVPAVLDGTLLVDLVIITHKSLSCESSEESHIFKSFNTLFRREAVVTWFRLITRLHLD